MIRTRVSGIRCPNPDCASRTRSKITRHGFFKLRNGSRRRRYRCNICGKSFCTNKGTPYYQLHCSRRDFDEVAAMSVEGVSISAIARIKGVSWNTVARWLKKATESAPITVGVKCLAPMASKNFCARVAGISRSSAAQRQRAAERDQHQRPRRTVWPLRIGNGITRRSPHRRPS